jgi:hypothetical protein
MSSSMSERIGRTQNAQITEEPEISIIKGQEVELSLSTYLYCHQGSSSAVTK